MKKNKDVLNESYKRLFTYSTNDLHNEKIIRKSPIANKTILSPNLKNSAFLFQKQKKNIVKPKKIEKKNQTSLKTPEKSHFHNKINIKSSEQTMFFLIF